MPQRAENPFIPSFIWLRRATGQKRPTSPVGIRGTVRVVAAVRTQGGEPLLHKLRPWLLAAWQTLRPASGATPKPISRPSEHASSIRLAMSVG